MSFQNFNFDPRIMARIEQQGFTDPTPIQAQAIPPALEGRDVIGLAQTGTGKTAAFVLPILQRLLTKPGRGIRALIVTPTRELAEQIQQSIRTFTPPQTVRSASVYGGVGMGLQERNLRYGTPIIVACPGRLLDHVERGYVRLDNLETLILDEADQMLDMGFAPAIQRILKYVPAERQTMLFSATMGNDIASLVKDMTTDPVRIEIAVSTPVETVSHSIYPIAEAQKASLLLELLHGTATESVLVFTRTKHRADRVATNLERAGYQVGRLHSNRSQNQRRIALDGFRNGRLPILVATDIAARGIDVTRVSHVINYDMPDTSDAYIHRIGRTGRATRTGDALTFVTPQDVGMLRAIERVLGDPIDRRSVSGVVAAELPTHGSFNKPFRRQNQSRPFTGERSNYSSDRPRNGERSSYSNDRPRSGDRPAYSNDRPRSGDRPAYSNDRPRSGDRPAYNDDRPRGGDRPSNSDRPAYSSDRPRSGDRPAYNDDRPRGGDRPAYSGDRPRNGDRPAYSGERGPRRDRPARGPRREVVS